MFTKAPHEETTTHQNKIPPIIKKPDGSVEIPPKTLEYLDNLKNTFPVDQWNQYRENGTFDGVEITAGNNRQAFVAVDLWRKDGQTPWGDAEIKTIVIWGREPNSIALKEGFRGTGWVYPQDIKGNGWNEELVVADSATGISRRVNQGENIAKVMIVPLGDTGEYILVDDQRKPLEINGKIAWQGKLEKDYQNLTGILGLIPLPVLIDLDLASIRHS
ncbi:MAG: hypothetical protein N2482_03645 [Patescibacteria group bacterium]|nr:hypothetical protein [Patescibacteria group bacterium]